MRRCHRCGTEFSDIRYLIDDLGSQNWSLVQNDSDEHPLYPRVQRITDSHWNSFIDVQSMDSSEDTLNMAKVLLKILNEEWESCAGCKKLYELAVKNEEC